MSKVQNSVMFSLPQVSVPDPLQQATGHYDYVYFGVDNMYPQYVADLVNVSPTHSAIITAKTALLNASLILEEDLDIKLDLDDLDGKGGNVEDFYSSMFVNLSTFEGAYIEVIYNKQKTRVVKLSNIPYENVRVGKYTEEGNIDTVYISPDWSRKYIKKNAPKPMATYDPENIDTDSQVMVIRLNRPNQPYYTVPGWMSAVQAIFLEDDVLEYSRNSILNGFTPSTIFNFHGGEPDEDGKESMESSMKRKFTGKASTKFLMFYDNDKDKSVDITQLAAQDIGAFWESLSPIISDKIFTGHKIYPSLVGVPTSNGFSSNTDELEAQYALYLKTTIIPLQKLALGVLRKVIKFNINQSVELKFKNELINTDTEEVDAVENTSDNVKDEKDTATPNEKDNASKGINTENGSL